MPLATQETDKNVWDYLNNIEPKSKREDAKVIVKLMQEITGYEPKIWGDYFIIGFGKYTYRRKGGKEDFEWFHTGFAVRKTKITLYLTTDITQEEELLNQLGKCTWGKGCLYVNKLADINPKILKKLIQKSTQTK